MKTIELILSISETNKFITIFGGGECVYNGDSKDWVELAKLLAKDKLFEGWNQYKVITIDESGGFDESSIYK